MNLKDEEEIDLTEFKHHLNTLLSDNYKNPINYKYFVEFLEHIIINIKNLFFNKTSHYYYFIKAL